jgi:hypothetical protein
MSNPELTGRPSALDRRARKLARMATPAGARRHSASTRLARGLGWFSIGWGVMELLAARPLARLIGLQGHESLLRACGMREIACGIGILVSRRAAPQSVVVWSRVAGDTLDLYTLGAAAVSPRPRGSHPFVAMAAVAGVTALDVACAWSLQREANAARQTTDYSHRSGLAAPPEQMRGAALASFVQPADMRVSRPTDPGLLH